MPFRVPKLILGACAFLLYYQLASSAVHLHASADAAAVIHSGSADRPVPAVFQQEAQGAASGASRLHHSGRRLCDKPDKDCEKGHGAAATAAAPGSRAAGQAAASTRAEAAQQASAAAPAAAGGPPCRRLLWFTAVDAISTAEGSYRIWNAKAALDSALEHAPSLQPVLIYGGKADDPVAQHYRGRGAIVLLHDVSFLPDHPEHMRKRRAQFYRLDAPALAKRLLAAPGEHAAKLAGVSSSTILYTDTDILFERDVSSCSFSEPRILALSPESQPNQAYNSGVMAMNIEGFLGIYDQLLAYARSVGWTFYGGTLQDQGLINEFFMQKMRLSLELLPNEFNWKGYWGSPIASQPLILHFHGFKADLCLRTYLRSKDCPNGLWRRICEAMGYGEVHFEFASRSPDDAQWRRMYQQYLHHSGARDDLSHSCWLAEPLPPPAVARPHNLSGLLTRPEEAAAL